MQSNLLRQFLAVLLTGVLLMPVLGKALHTWEEHDLQIIQQGDEQHFHDLQVECFVCDYLQFNFHDELQLELPVQQTELISDQPSFFEQMHSKLLVSQQYLRGPPAYMA